MGPRRSWPADESGSRQGLVMFTNWVSNTVDLVGRAASTCGVAGRAVSVAWPPPTAPVSHASISVRNRRKDSRGEGEVSSPPDPSDEIL